MKAKSSLKNWSNAVTPATPSRVARLFAVQNLGSHPLLLQKAIKSLDLFECGDALGAKRVVDEVPRSEFATGQDYFLWAQFKALFLKSSFQGDERKRESLAEKKFLASEASCKRTNKRLRWFAAHPNRENPLMRSILTRARGLISQVLGNFTESTLEHLVSLSRPGGGTAIGTKDSSKVTLPYKLGPETDLMCTKECLPYASLLVEGSPSWLRLVADVDWERRLISVPYVVTSSNLVAFVPKDAVTARTIAIEPHLNLCLQLGVHEYIAKRLAAYGVSIEDQSRNQLLARKGAAEWASLDPLSTLDLSSASDTVSIALVERLVPSVWCDYLRCLRSPSYALRGADPVEYQKWSSMGNGYTFVLETLIFWALAKACTSWTTSESVVSAYGDDIIVPRGASALLVEVLRYTGFSCNNEKSAIFGPFRESCGEDYWGVERVVPFYFRYMTRLRPTDIYRFANTFPSVFNSSDARRYLLQSHRGRPVLYGLPCRDESACIWRSDFEFLKKGRWIRWVSHLQAWEQRVAVYKPLTWRVNPPAGLAAALLGDRKISDKRIEAKSTLRRRGRWVLKRVITG